MGLKNIKDFSAEEVGLWLAAGGLGDHASKFVDEGVDGDLLLSLTADDFKNDLGLSGLQSKKVLKNIEFSKNLLEAGGGGEGGGEEAEELRAQVAEMSGDKDQLKAVVETLTGDKDELQKKVQEMEDVARLRDDEIAALKAQMDEMKIEGEKQQAEAIAHAPAPRAAPAPAPAPQSHHHQPRKPRVVGGAARGAAGGAMKGAIAGAILPGMDAGDGAAAGAAVGATTGGLGAIRGRRRMGRR